MSQDKRRDRRVDTSQGIWMEGQDVRIQAEAKNMSKGGMFVLAPQGAANQIGRTLEINFEDAAEGKISLKMEVVWRDEKSDTSKIGLRALDSIGKAAFDRVVSRYLDAAKIESSNGEGAGDAPSDADK